MEGRNRDDIMRILDRTFCDSCGEEIKKGMRLFYIGNQVYCKKCWFGER
jgi:hypothetical protein